MALIAGPQGTELHQRIIETAPAYLKRHGALIMEMGMGQADLLLEMIRTSDAFIAPSVYKDLAGIERVLVARKA
jgi:release factor glutamine methyltransferase